jgi:hypothetical protein
MSAGKYSFNLEQGATYRFGIQYTDASGSYIDLSGYNASMQIRSDYADNSNTLYATINLFDVTSSVTLSTGSYMWFSGSAGTSTSASVSGSIEVYLHADTTATFNFEEAVYDIELYSGDDVYRLLEGTIINKKEVTRI